MNTLTPYIVGSSCILKGGDTADDRMTELNVLIASGKGSVRAFSGRLPKVLKARSSSQQSAHCTLAASKLRSIGPAR
jgi:hypothetical protein